MKKRGKKRRRRKTDKRLIGLVLIISLIIIVAVYYAVTEMFSPKEKFDPEEYFEILNPVPSGVLSENGTKLLVYYLLFNISAVMGDAHEVIVNSGGVGMAEPIWVGTILEGDQRTIFVSFEMLPINLRLKGGEFEVSLQITSVEATGPVKIRFPPSSVLGDLS